MAVALTQSLQFTAGVEADDRMIYPTVEAALVTGGIVNGIHKPRITLARRVDGLPVWIQAERRTYRFVGGITNDHFIPDPSDAGAVSTHDASETAHDDIRAEMETLSQRIDAVQSGGLKWLVD